MLKRLLVLALPAALCLASFAIAAEPTGAQHRGEIMSVDREAKTITVKIVTNDSRENHVYHVVDGVTVIRDPDQKVISFGDLKAGQHISIHSRREKGDRVAMEITLKPAKGSKKKS